jgi:hypothetical protein
MATIVTRAGKGSPLTHNEVDANFTNLNSDKIESGDTVASLTLTAVDVADKITHTGDTNTAIRFPAADTVTVETAGSERVRIDSSGNVGIGTSSPTGLLTIGTNVPRLDFLEANGSAGFDNTIFIRDADVFAIQTRNGGTFVSNDYRITANASGALTHEWRIGNSEKMRIDSSGNVGIGTNSPSQALEVFGAIRSSSSGGFNQLSTPSDGDCIFSNNGNNWLRVKNGAPANAMRITASGNVGINTNSPSEKLDVSGNVTISGSLSKGSGSFKIDHPIKFDTHHLVHSFIEGPQADNIYRGKVALVGGTATVNLDEAGRMTEGTFVALNGNVQCFTTNEDGWTAVRGKVDGNILTIEAQDAACTDTVSWLVIGERHDQHMLETNWTDEQGRIITEPEKVTAS